MNIYVDIRGLWEIYVWISYGFSDQGLEWDMACYKDWKDWSLRIRLQGVYFIPLGTSIPPGKGLSALPITLN